MTRVASELPVIVNAKLPLAYETARNALAMCARIDECKKWADKAAAMASYAKQSKDKSLFDMATRIKARAIERCGQLLGEYKRKEHAGRPKSNGVAVHPISAADAGRKAKLSDHQVRSALRVAAIPDDERDAMIESGATVTELAKRGTKARPLIDPAGRTPEEMSVAIDAYSHVSRLAEFAETTSAASCARGQTPARRKSMGAMAATASLWLNDLAKECRK